MLFSHTMYTFHRIYVFLTRQIIARFVERQGTKAIRITELIRAENWHEKPANF